MQLSSEIPDGVVCIYMSHDSRNFVIKMLTAFGITVVFYLILSAVVLKISGSDTVNQCSGELSSKRVRLSIDLERADIRSVPTAVLNSIMEKAEKMLNNEGSVVQAPGADTAYMIESQTSKRPHYVTLSKNGKVTCDDCPGWKVSKICAHSIAAAEKAGATARYMKWLREKGPATMNMTSLMTFDSSGGIGRKGGKASTARRKGGRTANQPEVTAIVHRPFLANLSRLHVPNVQPPTVLAQVPLPLPGQQTSMAIPGPPAPKLGEFMVYLLQFCPPMVRTCYGCLQPLKHGGFIARPPYDLVIVSRMNRGFRPSPNDEMMFKEGNVYFHVHQNCIKMKQPYFKAEISLVPGCLLQHLKQEHIQLLKGKFTQKQSLH